MKVEVLSLSYERNGSSIINEVTFGVDVHEILAIMGPNGAGKTTLLRLIGLLDRPTRGRILFDGADPLVEHQRIFNTRRRMSLLFQSTVLFDMTVWENVAYPLSIRNKTRQEIGEKVHRALNLLELTHLSSRHSTELSGGEARRVALARALVTDPELLLLDEPTVNLDPHSTAIVEAAIQQVNRSSGIPVILTSHDVFQPSRLADRTGFLLGGRLVEIGSSHQILESPKDSRTRSFLKGEIVA